MKCAICQEEYTPKKRQPSSKYCSKGCSTKSFLGVTGRAGINHGIPSSTVGAISELVVCNFLMKSGWQVFKAVSPACFCDVFAVNGEETMFLEVRTGYRGMNGRLSFPKAYKKGVTHYAVVLPLAENEIIFIPV